MENPMEPKSPKPDLHLPEHDGPTFWLASLGSKIPTIILLIVFSGLLAGHSTRTFSRVTEPGIFDNFKRGFVDFHNAIHFPVKCFWSGKNPYSRDYIANHPDGRAFPLFPPQSLILHAPFGISDIATSRIAYFVFELICMSAILLLIEWIATGRRTLRGFLFIGIAMMMSIGFYTSFYMGQLTLQLVLGTIVALHFSRTRPLLAACALTVAACKPQFGVPLAVLLLCRGDWKAGVGGGLISVVLSGIGVAVICAGTGWESFVEEIKAVYLTLDSHPDVGTAIDNGWRLDIYPVFARLLTVNGDMPVWSKFAIPTAYLMIGGIGVFRLRKNRDADPLSNFIICLTCLGCIYHSVYDGILLLWPAAVLWLGQAKVWSKVSSNVKIFLMVILLCLMINVFHLEGMQRKLGIFNPDLMSWRIVASFGAIGIFVALLTTVGLTFQPLSETKHDPAADVA